MEIEPVSRQRLGCLPVIIAVALLGAVALGLAAVLSAVMPAHSEPCPAPVVLEPPVTDWRPDIRHCHEPGVDLWDCIRRADIYREDL